jgi:molecular chaperone GrpE
VQNSKMTESETQNPNPEDAAPAAEPQSTASGWRAGQASEEAGADEALEQLRSGVRSADVERLEAEKADLTDRLLRLAADMDNLRRRAEREAADARKYATQKFAADMLVVGDNLRRALDAYPEERRAAADEVVKAFIEGVEMTGREMDRLLQKNGIVRIAAQGERFDPHRHQAMFEVPNPDVPAGTVVQVVQDGYTIGDRVLRAAMVGVSTGGPAQSPAATQDASGEPARPSA